MKREIDAPAQDWLTEEEAVQYLRLTFPAWRNLTDAGWVLGEVRHTRQCVLYPWEAIALISLRLKLGDRPVNDSAKVSESGEKRGKVGESGA